MEDLQKQLNDLQDQFLRHNHNSLNSDALPNIVYFTQNVIAGGIVFICQKSCIIKKVTEVHSATATGATVVEKLTGTQAVGGGTSILSSNLSLATTANTVANGTLTNSSGVSLEKGDRLATYVSGSSAGITYQNITFEVIYG